MNRCSLLIILCALSFSCTPKVAPPVVTETVPQDKILFLAYEVTRDSVSGKVSTKILYQKTVNGTLKPGTNTNAEDIMGNWKIRISDVKDMQVETLVIENPLHKKVEYVGANGQLGMKDVWLTRAEVAVRFNYQPKMSLITIEEKANTKNNHVIFSHTIRPTDQ